MRRALFVTTSDRPGGAERVVASLARGLSQRPGWQVDFYVLCGHEEPSFTTRALGDSTVRVVYGPSARERYSVIPFLFFLVRARYDFGFSTHVHTNAVMCAMAHLRRSVATRLVTRESTVLFDRFEGMRRRFYQFCYSLYGAQQTIVAQSGYMAEHLKIHLPKRVRAKVSVVPNPVDLEEIRRMAEIPLSSEDQQALDGRHNIVFCGRLVEVKRPELAIQALAELKARLGSTIRLVIVGEGPLRPRLDQLVDELSLRGDVLFLGQRENPYQVLRACKYGLLTSSREGFPNVVLEMMACGVDKVVTTDCAGDLDKLPNVSVMTDRSPSSLAQELERAIDGRESHAASYLATVERRSVDQFLDLILGDELVRHKKPRGDSVVADGVAQ